MCNQFLKDLFTEKDGESFCVAKVLWFCGVIGFITLAAWSIIVHGNAFNAQDYGVGLGTTLGGGGLGVAQKGKTE